MDEDEEWLDAMFDDLMWELELEEAKAWTAGLGLFPDAEPLNEEGEPKLPSR